MTILKRQRHEEGVSSKEVAKGLSDYKNEYLKTLQLIERLHRQLLDVIKDDLERRSQSDINSVQAILLFNIGEKEMSVGELIKRGHYQGSNVSWNLKKLVDAGYIDHQRSGADRRAVRIQLTEKGQDVYRQINDLFARHCLSIEGAGEATFKNFEHMNERFLKLERFWSDQIQFRL